MSQGEGGYCWFCCLDGVRDNPSQTVIADLGWPVLPCKAGFSYRLTFCIRTGHPTCVTSRGTRRQGDAKSSPALPVPGQVLLPPLAARSHDRVARVVSQSGCPTMWVVAGFVSQLLKTQDSGLKTVLTSSARSSGLRSARPGHARARSRCRWHGSIHQT